MFFGSQTEPKQKVQIQISVRPYEAISSTDFSLHSSHKKSFLSRLNPFNWSKRTVRVFTALFFLIMMPIYLFIGMQPTISLDYSGYPNLEIPVIGLNTPVTTLELKNHQLIAPELIAGSFSQHDNKTLIIGHSSSVFEKLNKLKSGDQFVYQDKSYVITNSEVLAKSNVNMQAILAPAPSDTIILMTCAGDPLPNQDATHRLIVTATLM